MNTNKKDESADAIRLKTLDLLEKAIPEMEKMVFQKATAEKTSSIAPAESGIEEPFVEINRRLHNQLSEIMQTNDYQKLGDSSSRKVRYLFNNLKASEILADVEEGAILAVGPSVELPRLFNIDEIPSLTAWHGSKCEFLVDWRDNPAASFDVQAEPQPHGDLILERSTDSGTVWCFRYTPDINDKFPFTATITAICNDQSVSQTFEITPMAKLPPEQIVFATETHTQPGPVDFEKPEITEDVVEHTYIEDPKFTFNYKKPPKPPSTEALELRKIQILGETVVFDKDNDEYGLYRTYNNVQDVQVLEILAEKVIIRSPLRLHQTKVVINAKKLRFEGPTSKIITTPIELKKVPKPAYVVEKDGSRKPGEKGEDGLPAGDIKLNIEEFETDPSGIKFYLTGGKGQNGGKGKHGADGAKMQSRNSYPGTLFYEPYRAPAGSQIVYVGSIIRPVGVRLLEINWFGSKTWPGNGEHAVSSGKPGEGGAGGTMHSCIDVSDHVKNSGGFAGEIAMPKNEHRINKGGKWHYKGGKAGTPVNAIWLCLENLNLGYFTIYWWRVTKEHESKAGDDAEVGTPEREQADHGDYKSEANPFAWLHPILLNKLLNRAKNNYLCNRIEEAEFQLGKYIEKLDTYKQSSHWNDLKEMDRRELEQMYDEMQIMRHRIKNNLDYFGHPAGWTPLLSFEVNITIFKNEIERAAEILYYAYCIKNKASSAQKKFDTLVDVRDRLEKDKASAVSDYNKTISEISALRTDADNLKIQTEEIQKELEAEEEKLTRQATAKLLPIFGIRMGLKAAGIIVSMIPAYQPVTGALGKGITLLSNFDVNKPWDTIIGGVDITTEFLKSSYDKETKNLKEAMDKEKIDKTFDHLYAKGKIKEKHKKTGKITTRDMDENEKKKYRRIARANWRSYMDYLDQSRQSSAALSTGMKDMGNLMEKFSAPKGEIDAELEKLKAQSKEYKEYVNKIKGLLEQKRAFAEKLADEMQKVSSLSNYISRCILAIDATSLDLTQVQAGLDKRVSAYVDDMERRAYDRILEYHYYMAKAYEYRMLKPYAEPLDFKQLIEKLEKKAKVDSWDELSSDIFKSTYKVVFEDKLAEIANQIFREYNTQPKESNCKLKYLLSANELDRLNEGKSINVDFSKYLSNEENLRIVDVGILMLKKSRRKGDIKTTPANGDYPANAYLDLNITSPGISKLRSKNKIYQFQHPYLDAPNPYTWRDRYTPEPDLVDPHGPSAAGESLLKSLLEGDALNDMMLYSRPAVWADLQISKTGDREDENASAIRIDHLRLELSYDYYITRGKSVDIRVLVTTLQRVNDKKMQAFEASFKPYFIVNKKDLNKRQDARGKFLRIYKLRLGSKVKITAQPKYENWVFNKWTDVKGKELPETAGVDISIDLKKNRIICAQYISSDDKKTRASKVVSAIPDASLIGNI